MESDEFFYMVDGNRCDEDLHAPMFVTGIHVPSAQAGAFAAMKIGIGRAEAYRLYGLDEAGLAPLLSA